MALETATFLHQLDPLWPEADDGVNEGDDHFRLLKNVLQNTFPNVQGAMNASHTELNRLVGITANVAPNLVAADNTFNIGPTTGNHIAFGSRIIQAKGNATTVAELAIQSLGGNVDLGSQDTAKTGTAKIWADGVQVITPSTVSTRFRAATAGTPSTAESNNIRLFLTNVDDDPLVSFGYEGTAELFLDNRVWQGAFTVRGRNSAGAIRRHAVFDGAGGFTFYEDDAPRFGVYSGEAVGAYGTENNDPSLGGENDAELGLLNASGLRTARFAQSATVTFLESFIYGGQLNSRVRNSGGDVQLGISIIPDSGITFGHAGTVVALTQATGLRSRNKTSPGLGTPQAVLFDLAQANGTRVGYVGFDSAAQLDLASLNNGADIRIRGANDAGTLQLLATFDPDTLRSRFHGYITAGNNGDLVQAANELVLKVTSTDSQRYAAVNSLGGVAMAISATGNGRIDQTDSAGVFEAIMISMARNGAIGLNYAGANKLLTASDGVDVTGELRATVDLKVDGVSAIRNATAELKGRVELATATEVRTGTDAERAATPAALAGNKSLGTNGYYIHPGKHMEQWGTTSSISSGSSVQITLPQAFAAFSCVVANPVGAGAPNGSGWTVGNFTTTTFRIYNGLDTSATFMWRAVGTAP